MGDVRGHQADVLVTLLVAWVMFGVIKPMF